MPTIPYGKKALAIRDERHDFIHQEKIAFIDTDSEVNVNGHEVFYVFKSLERNLIQTLTEEEFEWA